MDIDIESAAKALSRVVKMHVSPSPKEDDKLITSLFEQCLKKCANPRTNSRSVKPTREMVLEIFMSNVDFGKFSKVSVETSSDQVCHILNVWENNREKYL